MFGVLDRLLLRPPIGVGDPEEVVRLYVRDAEAKKFLGSGLRANYLYQELNDYDSVKLVSGVAFTDGPTEAAVADEAGAVHAQADLVTGTYFQVLGVRPAVGRPLVPADDSPGSAPAAVVSYDFWKARYAGLPSVIGQVIRVIGRAYTIVGVAPRGFSGLSPRKVDLWLPARVAADDIFGPVLRNPNVRRYAFSAFARVRPGFTQEQVASELTLALRRRQPLEFKDPLQLLGPPATVALGSIIPGRAQLELGNVGESLRLSLVVGAVALIVCLIAMANVANLLLLRALGRRRETGIRLALGVSRWRLVRAVLAESLLLGVAAAFVAAWVASAGGELLRKLLLQDQWAAPVFSVRVFGFVAAAAFLVGIFTGLVPAFLGGRPDVVAALRAGVRHSTWRRSRVRAAFLVGQVALSVVLLAGLGLFARSIERAMRVDFGIDVPHLLWASTARPTPKASPVNVEDLLARVRQIPGVRAAGAVQMALPMFSYGAAYLRAEGVASLPNSSSEGGPFYSQIGAGYFEASGLRLLRGRRFAPGEYVAPATVALVSEAMARWLWPAGDPLGKCLYIQTGKDTPPCSTVVGVTSDVRQSVSGPPLAQYYVPLGSDTRYSAPEIVVRTVGDPERLVAPLTSLLKTVEPDLPDQAVMTLPSRLDSDFRTWRLGTALLGMFAALALLVSMVGLYSIVAFDGAQRTHEFGIRMALGAGGWNLAGLMVRQAVRYATVGAALGIVLALFAGRLVAKQLFNTTPRDPVVLVGAGLLLLISALAACALPARSAATVDPRISLQAD
jgi:predicted permease